MADLRHCATFDTAMLADFASQEVIAGLQHAETVGLFENEEDLEPA